MKTAVSIVTPFLNDGDLFQETARSVFRQTLVQWEWIIVAAASTSLLAEYARRDSRIRIVRPEEGVAAAVAPYIMLLDSGDLLEPTALEKLAWFLDCRPGVAVASGFSSGFAAQQVLSREGLHPRMIRRDVAPEPGAPQPSSPPPFENRLARLPGVRRLLLIVPHFELGGAEKFNLDLIACLQKSHGFEVTVVATLDGNHPWLPLFLDLTPDLFILSNLLPIDQYPRFLDYLMASRDFDAVLMSNSLLGYQLLPFLRSGESHAVFVDYVHMKEEWNDGGYAGYSLERASYLDFTLTTSENLRQWMIRRGGSPDRISVVTPNIDTQLWDRGRYDSQAIRKAFGIDPDVPVIVFAARFTDQKRPWLVAQAVGLLRNRGRRFVCIAAGDGPLLASVRKIAADRRLDQLRLIGARSSSEIRELLAIADLYFMPSGMEGIALAIYEAMSMEVVPVAADVGGQKELVIADCGILLPPDARLSAWTDALERLLDDVTLRKEMARQCRVRIQTQFDLPLMGDRMAEILSRARPEKPAENAASPERRYELALQAIQSAPDANSAAPGNQAPDHDPDYLKMLALAGAVMRGNLMALPAVLRMSRIGLRGLLKSVLMICSPARLGSKLSNLRLLAKVMANPAARARLLSNFDTRFYCSEYTDVTDSGIIPLLHYSLVGYAEGRIPSPYLEAHAADVEMGGKHRNPLLWAALDDC